MTDKQIAIDRIGAAMQRLHDLSDVLQAIAVAAKLTIGQIDEIEEALVSVADHIRDDDDA
jgi:hypothetical protein